MRVLGVAAVVWGWFIAQAQTKAVFAHFMVENAATWTVDQWKTDMALAQDAHIDAFALNIVTTDLDLDSTLSRAFQAAGDLGFHLFFSFDYAGGGGWASAIVINKINKYAADASYYLDGSKPLVSTFEGPAYASDWPEIKAKTDCVILPDWSSLGAKAALETGGCTLDGLFNWDPWPWGNTDMNTYVDASYSQYLNSSSEDCGTSLKYMMPASPWFYTNLPGYDKNWLWRGDDLWYDRWAEIQYFDPDYVEIISWNDFGESHHIGPLYVDDGEYDAFTIGEAPFNYAKDMPHDGWRELLPFVIDMYKTGEATISQEKLTAWYRVTPKDAACDNGGTTGNTASQLELEFWPYDVVQDKIFYSALLAEEQSVTVTVGGVDVGAGWTKTPSGGAGIYHGSVEYGSNAGDVVVTVGSMSINEKAISTTCDGGNMNWNAYVASAAGGSVSAHVDATNWVCIEGTGATGFSELCEFTCEYGYCPIGACYCTKMGPAVDTPDEDTEGYGTVGYPAAGMSSNYDGLCSFACNYGYCPTGYCGTEDVGTVIATVSPFTPNACTSGTSDDEAVKGLCSYACNVGYCPIHICTCLSEGALNEPATQTGASGTSAEGYDEMWYADLCSFTCSRGYCPSPVCVEDTTSDNSGSSDLDPCYIGVDVYASGSLSCPSPAVIVLPPSPLATTTTITVSAYTTSLVVGTTTTTITVTPTPITTNSIPFSNVPISGSVPEPGFFPTCTSIPLDDVDVTLTFSGTTTTRQLSLPPWPQITNGPPSQWSTTACGGWLDGSDVTSDNTSPTSIDDSWTDTTTTTTSSVLPIWTEFPPISVEPITTEIDTQCSGNQCPMDPDDETFSVKCDELWFFSFCINLDDLKVYGWKFTFPEGIIGPGPPPPGLDLGLSGWGFVVEPTWPPWPKITVGPGDSLTYEDEPSSCEDNKEEIPVELYTRSYGLSVSSGTTVTTTTKTLTETVSETGCPIPSYTSVSSCSIQAKRSAASTPERTAATASATSVPALHRRAVPTEWEDDNSCPGGEADSILYFGTDADDDDANAVYDRLDYDEAQFGLKSATYSGTLPLGLIFIYIWDMPKSLREKYASMSGVSRCYNWHYLLSKGSVEDVADAYLPPREVSNATEQHVLDSRAEQDAMPNDYAWYRSQVSSYPGEEWIYEGVDDDAGFDKVWEYYADDTLGAGQYVYLMEDGITESDPEYDGATIEYLEGYADIGSAKVDLDHGDATAKLIIGQSVGIVPKATMVTFPGTNSAVGEDTPSEVRLIELLQIIEHVENNNAQGMCVVSMAWSSFRNSAMRVIPEYPRYLKRLLRYLEETLKCVLVTSAGNKSTQRYADDAYPTFWKYTEELTNLVVAGASGQHGLKSRRSILWTNGRDDGMVYAPGLNLLIPTKDGISANQQSGTSLSTPLEAGLIAYLRGLDSDYSTALEDPATAVKMMKYLSRALIVKVTEDENSIAESPNEDPNYRPRVIWNGNVQKENCLTGYTSELATSICSKFLEGLPAPDAFTNWDPDMTVGSSFGSGSGSSSGGEGGLTWNEGSASPTCTADCGVVCKGYYCDPLPTGTPSDYADPAYATTTTTANTWASYTKPTTSTTSTSVAASAAPSETMPCIKATISFSDTPYDADQQQWDDTIVVDGKAVCSQVSFCACTAWSDDSCLSGYSVYIDAGGDMDSYANVDLTMPGLPDGAEAISFSAGLSDRSNIPCKQENGDAGTCYEYFYSWASSGC